jgi:hypothetical protein
MLPIALHSAVCIRVIVDSLTEHAVATVAIGRRHCRKAFVTRVRVITSKSRRSTKKVTDSIGKASRTL